MEEEGEYLPEEGEENVYEETGREELAEDDEISPEEEAFLKGYEDANTDENSELELNQ